MSAARQDRAELAAEVAHRAAAENAADRIGRDAERATHSDMRHLARVNHTIDRHLGHSEHRGDFGDGEELLAARESGVLRARSALMGEPLLAEIHVNQVARFETAVTAEGPLFSGFTGKSKPSGTIGLTATFSDRKPKYQ
jgi:hypothetical protein